MTSAPGEGLLGQFAAGVEDHGGGFLQRREATEEDG
jgi:hypothetical protein